MRPIDVVAWTVPFLFAPSVWASSDADAHHAEPNHAEGGTVTKSARTGSRDVVVPRALVARIEREYKEYVAKAQNPAKQDGFKRNFLNLTVELTQRRPVALHEDVTVHTPTGGGVVDLSEMVTTARGAFRVRFTPKREDGHALSTRRVFFVSRAKARVVDGEDFGDGCGKYMEITSAFNGSWARNGIEVYTADQRYLSVLGGTYIFVDFNPEALYVGSVTFTDSRFPQWLCG